MPALQNDEAPAGKRFKTLESSNMQFFFVKALLTKEMVMEKAFIAGSSDGFSMLISLMPLFFILTTHCY